MGQNSTLIELKSLLKKVLAISLEQTLAILEPYQYLDPSFKEESGHIQIISFQKNQDHWEEIIIIEPIHKWTISATSNLIDNLNIANITLNNTYNISIINQCQTYIKKIKNKFKPPNQTIDNYLAKQIHKIHEFNIIINNLENQKIETTTKIKSAQETTNWAKYESLSSAWSNIESKIINIRNQKSNIIKSISPTFIPEP